MATLLLNGAGGSAADPILKGLGLEWVIAPTTMDAAVFSDAWVDQATGIPGTASIKGSLSPAATVVISGNAGSYDDTAKQLTISSTTGLSVGDYLYLSHASITSGVYQIATLPAAGKVTLVVNPFNGLGNKTGISYQACWRYVGTAGTAPIVSSGAGTQNFFKARTQDSVGNNGQLESTCTVADAPAGAAFIALAGKSYTGQTVNVTAPSLAILPAWANAGGVAFLELANHSVQARNDFTFGDATITERSLAAAKASGLKVTAGDGIKYGRLNLKSMSSGAVIVGVDLDLTIDTLGPTLTFLLNGR
jgi:hypothetical protein